MAYYLSKFLTRLPELRNKERREVTRGLNCRQILQLKVQIALFFSENRSL